MTAVTSLSRQAGGVMRAVPGPRSASPGPACATAAWRGPETAALAAVEALDGADRKLLLDHLAATSPDVVSAGARWLAGWHAAARERRRKAANAKGSARSRAKRQAGREQRGQP